MNKKIIIYIILVLIVFAVIIIIGLNNKLNTSSNELEIDQNYNNTENNNVITESNIVNSEDDVNTSSQEQLTEKTIKEKVDMIKLKVNNNVLEVKLEENEATKSLVEKLKKGNIKVNAKEYGGFEKVGNLGFSLPRNDKSINTSAGDIVLYQGNQISLFYNSNSWNYTKLGKIENISSSELKNILGSGDVTLILSLD